MTTKETAAAIVADYLQVFLKDVEDPKQPFVGAMPKFLTAPEIATAKESAAATRVACAHITKAITAAKDGVVVVCGQDSAYSATVRKMLDAAVDTKAAVDGATSSVCLGLDWMHTMPIKPEKVEVGSRLLIYLGTPGKYLMLAMQSALHDLFDTVYKENRLVVVTKGAIMLPLGTQEENIYGAHPEEVIKAIFGAISAKGPIAWGHGPGTKEGMFAHAFSLLPESAKWHVAPPSTPLPSPMSASKEVGHEGNESLAMFDAFGEYVLHTNKLKLSQPHVPVVNYFDSGLTVTVVQGVSIKKGASMLTDRDGLAMLRDSSIGHIISKMNQITNVKSMNGRRGVYNFFIGDGAARCNYAGETAFHDMENFSGQGFITLFIYNNHKWAIEDNLVKQTSQVTDDDREWSAEEVGEKEHLLFNKEYYDALGTSKHVTVTSSFSDLQKCFADLTEKQNAYMEGKAPPQMHMVVVRGMYYELPVMFGDVSMIKASPEMAFLRSTFGCFAEGIETKIPFYGCSHFESIQFVKMLLDETPEGKAYEYVCGRTDIQAAHMTGMEQPEGKAILFINDVFGINSLGEALRMNQSGFGGKQVLIYVWHPAVLKIADCFTPHRPPLVYPSLGPMLTKYYVRKEADAAYVDFDGSMPMESAAEVNAAIKSGTPLVVINMLPEFERNYFKMDVRAKVPPIS